ncbi:hypothetical protein HA402_003164 [Bradysia odoriphaga]|nr:hypothetical protein HA402_003164 [Bradysia odoriphaga]
MNSRKINFNRNKKRIGNLITGILHQFGESTVQNLTKNVSIRSNQSMDYIGSAVRRSLRCGARTGFIVQTGQKTFKLPFQCYETDEKIEYNRAKYEECYKRQQEKKGATTTKDICYARNLIDHEKCTSQNKKIGYCYFHSDVFKYLQYIIDFVDNFYKIKGIKDEIWKYKKYAAFWDRIDRIENEKISGYKKRLLTFLKAYKKFLLGISDDFWMKEFPPNHEEKQDKILHESKPAEEKKSKPAEEKKSKPAEEKKSKPAEEKKSKPAEEKKSKPAKKKNRSLPKKKNRSLPKKKNRSLPKKKNRSLPKKKKSKPAEEKKSKPAEEKKSKPAEEKKSKPAEEKKLCVGINIENGTKCSNQAESWPLEQDDLCSEHQYITTILKIFGRSPMKQPVYGSMGFSAFDQTIARKIFEFKKYPKDKEINLTNFCVLNHVTIVFRYLNLWINKRPYLESYNKALGQNINQINNCGVTWTKYNCQCIGKEDIEKIFAKFAHGSVQFEEEAEIAKDAKVEDKNVNDRKRKNPEFDNHSPKPKKKDRSGRR